MYTLFLDYMTFSAGGFTVWLASNLPRPICFGPLDNDADMSPQGDTGLGVLHLILTIAPRISFQLND